MDIAVLTLEPDEATQLCAVLSGLGLACHACENLPALLDHLAHNRCDMLVATIPAVAIVAVGVNAGVRTLRGRLASDAPILLLASPSDQEGLIAALSAGANDYLLTPLRRGELATRTQVLLKRAYPHHPSLAVLRFGPFAFEPAVFRATAGGQTIDLTRKEFELALLFFQNLGRPLSRAYILDVLWPDQADLPSRTLDTHVSRVRTKLDLRPKTGYRLVPVYSYGYRLESLDGGQPAAGTDT